MKNEILGVTEKELLSFKFRKESENPNTDPNSGTIVKAFFLKQILQLNLRTIAMDGSLSNAGTNSLTQTVETDQEQQILILRTDVGKKRGIPSFSIQPRKKRHLTKQIVRTKNHLVNPTAHLIG